MILMWLGSFVLMLWGLSESQKAAATVLGRLQARFLEKGFETKLTTMFMRATDVAVLEASPQRTLYSGLAFYNLRILPLRAAVLIMGLSTLGAWWVLILGLLFLSFNGFFLLGICILSFLVFASARVKNILSWIFATGVFLVGGETMLRNSSVIQSVLGQSDLAFFLADGRFGAVLPILLAGIVITFFIRIEFWSLALALSLLVTSTLSFNGAMGLIAGERIGRMLVFWWRSRSLNQDCRRIGKQFSLISILGVIFGFWIAGEMRNFLDLGFSADTSFQDKSLQLVVLFAVILFFQWLAQMIWGHFGSLVKVDELQEARYFPASWLEQELLSATALGWAKGKVHKRLSEIRYHLQGLGSLKEGQVPDHIQNRLKEEERALSALDQRLKA